MEKDFQADKIEYIYIHIPFCIKKCPYCSFYSEKYSKNETENYISFLKKEILLYKNYYSIKPKTIYLGGGTPNLLSPRQINEIINLFDISKTEEITIEANPIVITENYLKNLLNTPVNRISLGIQSMINSELKILGRLHKAEDTNLKINLLKKYGYNNFSIDLMYGLPDQKISDVEYSIKKMIEFNPKHISIYCLSLEKDVPMFKYYNRIPNDEILNKMYYLIRNILTENNFLHYEISNFARKGFESIHNSAYWTDKYYLGFGPSAAGYVKGFRYDNPNNLKKYYQTISNKIILPNAKKISQKNHMEEFLFLGLRLAKGIDLDEFEEKFGNDNLTEYIKSLQKYIDLKLVIKKGNRMFLAPDAYFISNEIFSNLLF